MEKVLIELNLLRAIVSYLAQRPYAEVHEYIFAIQEQAQQADEQKKEEEKEEESPEPA